MKFIIKDWADNIKFRGKEFNSFDDAEEYLTNFFYDAGFAYDVYRGEYTIEERKL